jgi:hypothetical protein
VKRLPEYMVQLIMMLIFIMLVFNIGVVSDRATTFRVTVILIVLIGVLIINQLFGEIETPPMGYRSETEDLFFHDLLTKHVLITYSPESRNEDVIRRIIDYARDRSPVVLVSSAPKSEVHLQRFVTEVETGDIRLVEVSAVAEAVTEGNPMKVPLRDMDQLEGVISAQAKGTVVIFDSLSDIITSIGSEDTYRLFRKWLEMSSQKGIRVMAFLNQKAQKKRVVDTMGDLFLGVALIRNGRLRKIR